MRYQPHTLDELRRLFFYQSEYHAEMWRSNDGRIGYSPACEKRFSDECKSSQSPCGSCTHRALMPLTDERLSAHLDGSITLGAYQLRKDGSAGWLCWDVDADQDTHHARENVRLMTKEIHARCRQIGLPAYVEWTGKKGFHLWVFVPEGVDAALLRRLGAWVVSTIVDEEGSFAGIHVETFPKQTSLQEGDFGNLVKVPLSKHRKTGAWCAFVDPETLEPIGATRDDQHNHLLAIETMTAQEIANIVADWVPDGEARPPNVDLDPGNPSEGHRRLSKQTRDFLEHGAPVGERNDRLFRAACDLFGNNYEESEVLDMVMMPAQESGLSKGEIRSTVRSAASKPRTPSVPQTEVGGEEDSILSDSRNGIRLVQRYGRDLRFCKSLGGWFVWNGQRWARDEYDQVMEWGKQVAYSLSDLAAQQPDELRSTFARRARTFESMKGVTAMLKAAESDKAVRIKATDFDLDPLLLNCENGTLDLRTGVLREHRREDLITRLAPVIYQPDVSDPTFERYLVDATGGDADYAAYLQSVAGYTLTGQIDNEKLFLMLGPGATGKSTLIEAMMATLGDYAVKASFDTFLVQRNPGGPRPDLIAMIGARMVAATEPDQGRALAMAQIKELTGGDTISARDMYKTQITFRPTYKIWLAANKFPAMDADDDGLWRRPAVLPFEQVVPESDRNPEIKKYLMSPAGRQAILSWAVEGCLRWQRESLREPACVVDATRALRRKFDPLTEFLDECCVIAPGLECEATQLRVAYNDWAKRDSTKPLSDKDWGIGLKRQGCISTRKSTAGRPTVWLGIGLLTDQQDQPGSGPEAPAPYL